MTTSARIIALYLITPMLLLSCGIRLKGAKRIENTTVESFIVEGGGIQYFIKPLKYTSQYNNLVVDFTLRAVSNSGYKAKLNFTETGEGVGKIDSCQIAIPSVNKIVLSAKHFEKRNLNKGVRYFSEVDNKAVYHMFRSEEPFQLIAYRNGISIAYHPARKAIKKIKRIPKILLID